MENGWVIYCPDLNVVILIWDNGLIKSHTTKNILELAVRNNMSLCDWLFQSRCTNDNIICYSNDTRDCQAFFWSIEKDNISLFYHPQTHNLLSHGVFPASNECVYSFYRPIYPVSFETMRHTRSWCCVPPWFTPPVMQRRGQKDHPYNESLPWPTLEILQHAFGLTGHILDANRTTLEVAINHHINFNGSLGSEKVSWLMSRHCQKRRSQYWSRTRLQL